MTSSLSGGSFPIRGRGRRFSPHLGRQPSFIHEQLRRPAGHPNHILPPCQPPACRGFLHPHRQSVTPHQNADPAQGISFECGLASACWCEWLTTEFAARQPAQPEITPKPTVLLSTLKHLPVHPLKFVFQWTGRSSAIFLEQNPWNIVSNPGKALHRGLKEV